MTEIIVSWMSGEVTTSLFITEVSPISSQDGLLNLELDC